MMRNGRGTSVWRKLPGALASMALVVAATSPAGAAVANKQKRHQRTERLVVLAAGATPLRLPPQGGSATVTASVRGATTCWATAYGGPHNVRVSVPKPRSCTDGAYRQALLIGPNVTKSPVVVKLKLTVEGANGQIAGRAFRVTVSARHVAPPRPDHAAAPVVLRASATPARLPAGGGQVVVAGSVRGATSCRLDVLSQKGPGKREPGQKGLKVTLPKPVACSDGMYGQPVTVGPNKSALPVTVKLALVATGAKGANARGVFYVVLASPSKVGITPVGELPSGVLVRAVRATAPLGRSHVASAPVTGLGVVVHVATKALRGLGRRAPTLRLVLSDMAGQLVASAPVPSTCGRYLVKFSKPVPPSTLLLFGLEQRWGRSTWVPDGARAFFDLARSPISFTVQGPRGNSTPVVLEKGATTC
jgi:hypothetical protein